MFTTYEWDDTPHDSESIRFVNGEEVGRNIVSNPTMDLLGPSMGSTNGYDMHNNPYIVDLPVPSPNNSRYGQVVDAAEGYTVVNGTVVSVYDVDGLGQSSTVRYLSVYVYSPSMALTARIRTHTADTVQWVSVPAGEWVRLVSEVAGSGWGLLTMRRADGLPVSVDDKVYWTDLMGSETLEDFYSGSTTPYFEHDGASTGHVVRYSTIRSSLRMIKTVDGVEVAEQTIRNSDRIHLSQTSTDRWDTTVRGVIDVVSVNYSSRNLSASHTTSHAYDFVDPTILTNINPRRYTLAMEIRARVHSPNASYNIHTIVNQGAASAQQVLSQRYYISDTDGRWVLVVQDLVLPLGIQISRVVWRLEAGPGTQTVGDRIEYRNISMFEGSVKNPEAFTGETPDHMYPPARIYQNGTWREDFSGETMDLELNPFTVYKDGAWVKYTPKAYIPKL